MQKPTSEKCFAEVSGPPSWRSLPTWYVRSASDRMLHPDAQAWFVERLGGRSVSIDSSHCSPDSHPHEVADAILEAVGG